MSGNPVCPTTKLEKLLLATDGSEFSEGAAKEAISLAKNCSSKLFAVAVVETNQEFEALAPELVEKSENKTRELLEAVKAMASKEGVDCETIAHRGENPYLFIVEEASKQKADMIIIGRRGRSGLKRLLMGSVTAKVVGHAPCNVLVVPKASKFECRNILVATDGSSYSEAAVAQAIKMAKQCGSGLTIVEVVLSELLSSMDVDTGYTQEHVEIIAKEMFGMAEKNVQALQARAEKEGTKADGLTVEGRPFEAIIEAAHKTHADLIVVGSHGRTGLNRLLMGSVAERVIGSSECAVLVVKSA